MDVVNAIEQPVNMAADPNIDMNEGSPLYESFFAQPNQPYLD